MSIESPTSSLESIPTPIRSLLQRFQNAPVIIAPERKNELEAILKNKRLQLTLDCVTPRFVFVGGCGWQGNGIEISLSALESFWMLSYVTCAIYSKWETNGFEGSITLDRPAEQLAETAKKRFATNMHWDWPPECPRPDYETAGDKVAKMANWLFVGNSGFAFLHELGHVVREHKASDEMATHTSFRDEFEADEWAYDWIMAKWDEEPWPTDQPMRRSIFISGLFTLMAARSLCCTASEGKITHPNIIDRMLRFLIKYSNEDSGLNWQPAWRLPVHILPFFMKLNNATVPQQQFDNFREALNAYRPFFKNY